MGSASCWTLYRCQSALIFVRRAVRDWGDPSDGPLLCGGHTGAQKKQSKTTTGCQPPGPVEPEVRGGFSVSVVGGVRLPSASMSPSMSRSRSRSPYGRSRSRSRSASPDGRRSRSPRADRGPCDVITLTYDEVGFVLGKLGSTKRKIERVSGARLDLHERDHRLEIFGSEKERSRAAEYTRFVLDQRTGDVQIDLSIPRDDLSIVDVPTDTVGFVMGRGGAVLRGLEDEWGTLMFFAKGRGRNGDNPTEKLAIFGSRRSRRGAELKVLSAVEHKHAGFFLSSDGELHKPLNQVHLD